MMIEKLEYYASQYKRMLNEEYDHRGYTAEYFNYMSKYDSLTGCMKILQEIETYGYTR